MDEQWVPLLYVDWYWYLRFFTMQYRGDEATKNEGTYCFQRCNRERPLLWEYAKPWSYRIYREIHGRYSDEVKLLVPPTRAAGCHCKSKQIELRWPSELKCWVRTISRYKRLLRSFSAAAIDQLVHDNAGSTCAWLRFDWGEGVLTRVRNLIGTVRYLSRIEPNQMVTHWHCSRLQLPPPPPLQCPEVFRYTMTTPAPWCLQ